MMEPTPIPRKTKTTQGIAPHRFRQPVAHDRESTSDDEGEAIRCGFCGHVITHDHECMDIRGNHAHVFANPHGLVFRIRCFRSAPGCASVGPASTEFTWFSGFSWQVVLCRGCGEHLGWFFSSVDAVFHDPFYGLIADHLVEGPTGRKA